MNQQPEHPLYQRLLSQLQRRIEPHPVIIDSQLRQSIRLFTIIIMMCIVLVFVSLITQPLIIAEEIVTGQITLAITLVWLIGVYGICRTPYAIFAIYTGIIAADITIFVYTLLVGDLGAFVLNFLAIITLVATLTLQMRTAVVTAIAGSMGIFLFAISGISNMDLHSTFAFSVISNILILMMAYLRQRDANHISQSEQRLRSLMEANLEIIVFFDKAGKVLDVNQAFVNITGFPAEDILNTSIITLLAQRSRPDALRRWHENDTVPFRAVVRHNDGTHLHMEVQILSRSYDTQSAYVVVGRDITEQIQTERHGKEQEHSYQSLFTHTSDGVFIMDLDGIYLNANERAGHMLQCAVDDILGESVEQFIPEGEKEMVFQSLRRVLKGEHIPVYERHFQRIDGTSFPAEVSVMMVYNADNDPLHVQSLVRDISHREEVANRKLDLALQTERTHILRDFINDASHHFRTPLANIKTGVYLLSKIKNNPQKHEQQLQMMQAQANRMESLIDDLLTMVRLEDIDNLFQRESIPINSLLERLMDTVRARNWQDTHEWQLTDCKDDFHINADGNQLIQAFLKIMEVVANF
ncbi:MAG: PAS domain S-box protein [Aggregatilineales bacterium]